MKREFVGRVPVEGSGDLIDAIIEWDEMTIDHVETWQSHVQPHIHGDTNRSDQSWDWHDFFLGLLPFYQLRGYRPKCLSAIAYSDEGNAVPVGMLFILTRYPRIDSSGEKSTFTFFLTSAPASALAELGVTRIPNLGRYLVDCGMVLSVNGDLNGHSWLHCAPQGGERLLNYYAKICKLKKFPRSKSLPMLLPRNDGRYFFSGGAHAEALLAEFDSFRVSV